MIIPIVSTTVLSLISLCTVVSVPILIFYIKQRAEMDSLISKIRRKYWYISILLSGFLIASIVGEVASIVRESDTQISYVASNYTSALSYDYDGDGSGGAFTYSCFNNSGAYSGLCHERFRDTRSYIEISPSWVPDTKTDVLAVQIDITDTRYCEKGFFEFLFDTSCSKYKPPGSCPFDTQNNRYNDATKRGYRCIDISLNDDVRQGNVRLTMYAHTVPLTTYKYTAPTVTVDGQVMDSSYVQWATSIDGKALWPFGVLELSKVWGGAGPMPMLPDFGLYAPSGDFYVLPGNYSEQQIVQHIEADIRARLSITGGRLTVPINRVALAAAQAPCIQTVMFPGCMEPVFDETAIVDVATYPLRNLSIISVTGSTSSTKKPSVRLKYHHEVVTLSTAPRAVPLIAPYYINGCGWQDNHIVCDDYLFDTGRVLDLMDSRLVHDDVPVVYTATPIPHPDQWSPPHITWFSGDVGSTLCRIAAYVGVGVALITVTVVIVKVVCMKCGPIDRSVEITLVPEKDSELKEL